MKILSFLIIVSCAGALGFSFNAGRCPRRLEVKTKKCYRKFLRHQVYIKRRPLYYGGLFQLDNLKKLCKYRNKAEDCVENLRQYCEPYRYGEIVAGQSAIVDMSDLCQSDVYDDFAETNQCMLDADIHENDHCYKALRTILTRKLVLRARNEEEAAKYQICGELSTYVQCVSRSLRNACGPSVLPLSRKLAKNTLLTRIEDLETIYNQCDVGRRPNAVQIGFRNYNEPKTKDVYLRPTATEPQRTENLPQSGASELYSSAVVTLTGVLMYILR